MLGPQAWKLPSMFFKLFSCAPSTFSHPVGFLLTSEPGSDTPAQIGSGYKFFILHESPSAFSGCNYFHHHVLLSGLIFTIKSASLIVSSSCSTTITEFPRSRRCFKVPKQFIIIVSLMQSDTWFIQNICHTYESGTDLCCQTDSLPLLLKVFRSIFQVSDN